MIQRLGWAAAGTVLGFIIGGIGPRLLLADLEAEQDRLRVALALAEQQASPSRPRAMLPVPGMSEVFEPRSTPSPSSSSSTARPDGPPTQPDTGAPDPDAAPILPDDNGGGGLDPASIQEEFNLAVDAQRLRANQSRAALAEQADLDDAELEELDLVLEDMNAALAAYGEDLMSLALSGEEPDPEQMLGLTHEVTGILYGAQNQVNDLIGADALADTDPSARQVWNHIDLEVFRDAVEDMAALEGGR